MWHAELAAVELGRAGAGGRCGAGGVFVRGVCTGAAAHRGTAVPCALPVPAGQVRPFDAVADAQTPRNVPDDPPGAEKNDTTGPTCSTRHKAPPSSPAFEDQPEKGEVKGFDFYRDPLNAEEARCRQSDEIMKQDMARQAEGDGRRSGSCSRSATTSRRSSIPKVKMSRGKPLAVGPTARLARTALTWEKLAEHDPARRSSSRTPFPYPPLPHPKQATGGQVFPQMQIAHVPAARAVRRRFRPARRVPPRVPAGDLPAATARSWATSRAARSSRSTTTTGCSRTS